MTERMGVEPEEVVGKNLWEEFGDSIPDELEARYRSVMESGESAEFEQYVPDPFDYWTEARVFADDDGLSVYSRDISERKEYEERLKSQRDTLDVLNHNLTHDIRNDLQLVTAYAEMISDRLDEESQEYLETIRENANHAIELTKSASDISKALFTEDEQLKHVSLRNVLNTEMKIIRTEYPEASILVDGQIRDVTVVADDMLDSIFRNLLKNAVQHNDKPVPEVSISTEERIDEVVIRVADNGPGVPDAQKDTIFGKGEKGFENSGTGIGLYLVTMLIERYDGEVGVSDNNPEGAVFSVTLPKVDEEQSVQ